MLLLGAVGNGCWLFFLDFPGYTYPIKLGKLGITSFFVFAFALAFCYFGRHLLHENRSLELRLLTQLHNYLLLIKNGWHYDIKPRSSALTRFMVNRKQKKTQPCFVWWSVNTFFSIMKFSILTACLKTMSQNAAGLVKKKHDFDFDSSQVKW